MNSHLGRSLFKFGKNPLRNGQMIAILGGRGAITSPRDPVERHGRLPLCGWHLITSCFDISRREILKLEMCPVAGIQEV